VALSAHAAFSAGGGRRGRRRRGRQRGTLSEINVTPLVDVMLVLLIVFMISAPLLTAGVPLELPKTEASSIDDQKEPLSVSIQADGRVYIGDRPVAFASLSPQLREMAGDDTKKPIFVRADGKASYAIVAQVMAALSTSGFTSINLITDTGGPSSGGPASEGRSEAEPAAP
jgi:biopolymer transport protein TolR